MSKREAIKNCYAVTFTLKPTFTNNRSPREQKEQSEGLLYESLRQKFGNQLEELVLYAELTRNEDVHYHGYLKLKSRISRFELSVTIKWALEGEVFGFYNCKRISDLNGWLKYIHKDVYNPNEEYMF